MDFIYPEEVDSVSRKSQQLHGSQEGGSWQKIFLLHRSLNYLTLGGGLDFVLLCLYQMRWERGLKKEPQGLKNRTSHLIIS